MGAESAFDLKDKVVIVTGGAQGIGLAIARAMACAGGCVIIADLYKERCKRAAAELNNEDLQVSFSVTDVSKAEHVNSMVEKTIAECGCIDVLVNNAGMMIAETIENTTEEQWDKTFEVNLKGVLRCSRCVGKYMIERRCGNIINISSVAAYRGFDLRSAYCASKGGLSQLTKVMALEWSKYNIRVNAIAPGFVATALSAPLRSAEPERYQTVIERTPLGRFGKPDDFGGVAIFLASEASSFITGQTIFVDGGWSIT